MLIYLLGIQQLYHDAMRASLSARGIPVQAPSPNSLLPSPPPPQEYATLSHLLLPLVYIPIFDSYVYLFMHQQEKEGLIW